ncbi:MAG: glycoside hydrolase family 52 protein [bacterium]
MTTLQPLSCYTGFNAQHSPMGAFMSFTCGNIGTRGGIGLQIGQPGDQELYIGLKDGDRYSAESIRALPFYVGADNRAADAFLVEQAGPSEKNVRPDVVPFRQDEVERRYGWCTDEWRAPGMAFKIYTPFASIPNPDEASEKEMREALLPAVVALLEIDNTGGTAPKTGVFAVSHARSGTHVLDEDLGGPARAGFAYRREAGFSAELFDLTSGERIPAGRPFVFMRWSPSDGLREIYNPVHLLGTCPGFGFEVPPGKRYGLVIGIGSYLSGIQTTGLECTYLYTRYYKGLADVLTAALDRAGQLMAAAEALDERLESSGLSADQRFMIAHATHSYYGSTELLEAEGRPLWVVNEGEYCMMNTLDLAVDQVFWELDRNPWVVRNLLDTFVKRHSYVDEVKAGPDARCPGGVSFCHDMGAHNNFAPPGRSSYELANLSGTFSYMTQEQLCNWILTAGCYIAKTRDAGWLGRNRKVIEACFSSMINRGGDVGFAQFDSALTAGGQEITTYDSLDHSLAQTRNNVYIAVKCWASYRTLALLFRELGDAAAEERALDLARRVAAVVSAQAVDGVLPAVFEKDSPGYRSRILPASEGLIYQLYYDRTGWAAHALVPVERSMYDVLREHTRLLLLDPERRNLFADGGIKLSSTSNNSWISKIAIFMHVARRVFQLDSDPAIAEIFRKADAAHVDWQVKGSSYWACSDQIVSGVGKASRYYPRVVTTALWMS